MFGSTAALQDGHRLGWALLCYPGSVPDKFLAPSSCPRAGRAAVMLSPLAETWGYCLPIEEAGKTDKLL